MVLGLIVGLRQREVAGTLVHWPSVIPGMYPPFVPHTGAPFASHGSTAGSMAVTQPPVGQPRRPTSHVLTLGEPPGATQYTAPRSVRTYVTCYLANLTIAYTCRTTR